MSASKYDLRKKFAVHYFGADYDLGTARGRVVVDPTGAEVGFGRATAAASGFDKAAKGSGLSMGAAGVAIGGAGLAIAGGLAVAVSKAASFEKRMSAIEAVSGATTGEMDKMREMALRLGAETVFSAEEAAGAIEELIKAGLPVEDVLNGAADAAVNLAAAGEIDLKEAATIAANAMNAFNLEGKDMTRVADQIAGAANASAIDVSDFGQSLQQSGAAANLVGLDFEDLTVAIAAMGNAGIKGSDAGTSLKTFLSNLQPTTKKQIDLFRELGIVTEEGGNAFFDASGQVKGMSEIAGVLEEATRGMTDQQKALALETMFGSDAIRAAAIITGEGAAGMDELAASIGRVSAADVAEKRLDNLSGDLEGLSGSIDTLLINIGTPLQEGLRTIVQFLTELVNKLGEVSPETAKWIGYIAAAAAAILILSGGLLTLISVVGKVKAAMAALNAVTLANPYVLLALAIIAVGVALWQLYERNETFRKGVQAVWEWIQSNVFPIIEQVILGVQAMIKAFQGEGITSDGIVGFFEKIGVTARKVVDFIVNEVWPRIVQAFNWMKDEGVPALVAAWDWLYERVSPVIRALGPLIVAIFNRIKDTVTTNINTIKTVIGVVIGIIVPLWRKFGDNIMNVIEVAWNYVKGAISGAMTVIRGIIELFTGLISGDWSKAWNGLLTIVTGMFDLLWNTVKYFLGIIAQAFGIAWEAILAVVQWVWEGLVSIIDNSLTWVWRRIEGVLAAIFGFWQDHWNRILGVIRWIWDNVVWKVATAIGQVIAFVASIPQKVKDALWNAASVLWERGVQLISGLFNGIGAVVASTWQWMYDNVWTPITNFFSGAADWLYNAGKDILTGLWDGMKSVWEDVSDWTGGLGGRIIDLKGPPDYDKVMLVQNGELIMQGLQRGMMQGWEANERWLSSIAPVISQTVNARAITPFATAADKPSGGNVTIQMEFPNVGSAKDVQEIEQALGSSEVLQRLVVATRAGRRM